MADAKSVFVNVPFDRAYEPLFVTLIATLVFLGREPHCVLEVQETGQGRLQRIFQLIRSCPMSIHDLSRVGQPTRFNMPFELGLACGLALSSGNHDIVVLDAKPHRLDKTLSDYKGRDPLIHKNSCDQLVSCLLDLFVTNDVLPAASKLRAGSKILRTAARKFKLNMRSDTVFRPAVYRHIVAAASQLAIKRNFIAPAPAGL
jgi:hypothetical protein